MGNERGRQLCVIIPTYNNAGTVRQVIDDVLKYCPQIIVVNDGSTDGTSDILKTLPSTVTIVSYERNRGKGHALVAGFRKAMKMGFTHAITIDADGQHFADDIPHLIEALDHHKDAIIVGTRNLTEKNMPRQNTFANRFSNFWFRLQTGIDLQDTQSGYRLYTLSQLRAKSVVDYLVNRGIERERLVAKGYADRVPRTLDEDVTVNYNGQDYDKCRVSVTTGSSEWLKKNDVYEKTVTVTWNLTVPQGYDGIVVGLRNSGIDNSGKYFIYEYYNETDFLLFRVNNHENGN